MPEVTYYPEVRCTVTQGGLLPGGVTAQVIDAEARSQFVQVTRGMINDRQGLSYLPIGIVQIDRRTRRALVELPTEADSGANRMWVSFDSLRSELSSAGSEAVA